MPNINELPPDMGLYAASQRAAHPIGSQIVPLKTDVGHYAASQRAAHQILDNPKIFEDPLALRIIGAETESKLRLNLAEFQNPPGLDTFAYRNSFPLLRVFEVDHPVTQAWKRSCLEKAAIPIPASVTFVSVDFERQMMTDALRQSGFKNDELTFVSWLGVTGYLSQEAVISVLSSIVSSMRVGSEVVFDFSPPLQLKETIRRIKESFVVSGFSPTASLLQQLRERAYRMIVNRTFKNKDFRWTYFDPASLTRDLKRIGFADVQKELNVRYCKDCPDGLRIRNQVRLAKARV